MSRIILLLLVLAHPALADYQSAAFYWRVAKAITLDEAAQKVNKKVEGRILGGKTVHENGHPVHIIKVLTPDGHIRHIKIDSRTGKMSQQ